MNNELLEYIKSSLAKGISRETIETNLLRSGWQENQIGGAFQLLDPAISDDKKESKHSGLSLLLRIILSIIIFIGFFVVTAWYWYGVETSADELAEKPLVGINALSLLLIGFFLTLFPIVSYFQGKGKYWGIATGFLFTIFIISLAAQIFLNIQSQQKALKDVSQSFTVLLPTSSKLSSDMTIDKRADDNTLIVTYEDSEKYITIKEKKESEADAVSCAYFGFITSPADIEKRKKLREVPYSDCRLLEISGNKAAFYYLRSFPLLEDDLDFQIIWIQNDTWLYMEGNGCSGETKNCEAFSEKEFLGIASSFKPE